MFPVSSKFRSCRLDPHQQHRRCHDQEGCKTVTDELDCRPGGKTEIVRGHAQTVPGVPRAKSNRAEQEELPQRVVRKGGQLAIGQLNNSERHQHAGDQDQDRDDKGRN